VLERIQINNEETREYMKDLVEKIMEKPKEYVTDLAKEFLTSKHIINAPVVLFYVLCIFSYQFIVVNVTNTNAKGAHSLGGGKNGL
jgi:hypothetical protein